MNNKFVKKFLILTPLVILPIISLGTFSFINSVLQLTPQQVLAQEGDVLPAPGS